MEKIKLIIFSYWKKIVIVSIVILLLVIVSTTIYLLNKDKKVIIKNDKDILLSDNTKESKEETNDEEVYFLIDIKGAVNKPGVYKIDSNSRIIDAINKAEGLRNDADISIINLSKKIFDEMVIIIYTKDEVNNFVKVKEEENIKKDECIKEVINNDGCLEIDMEQEQEEKDNNSKININTATLEELMTLPGIGEGKANDIITYRNNNGLFKRIEDIMNVSGIGTSTFDKIKENITV